MRSSLFAKGVALLSLAAATAGCTVFPSPDPVQTYRFGALEGPAQSRPVSAARLSIDLKPVEFVEASRNDRLLGVVGNETAYLGGARWVSRAQDLYEDSLRSAFAERPDQVQLLSRREPGPAPLSLQVSVTRFEARYAAHGAVPDVVVSADAVLLSRGGEGNPAGREAQTFTVVVPASANRVGSIVTAYDEATQSLNRQLRDWVIQNGR